MSDYYHQLTKIYLCIEPENTQNSKLAALLLIRLF